MDELYYRLVAKYPNFPLPAMPRKTLFVGESDIRERRGAFDELMKAIAKHPTLATCSELMEFLGKTKYGSASFMWTWVTIGLLPHLGVPGLVSIKQIFHNFLSQCFSQ